MDEIDISWMAPAVRKRFLDGVRMFAEAVRDGAVMHMQDGLIAMKDAEQTHLRLQADPPDPTPDAAI